MTIHPRHNTSPAIAAARDILRIPHAITANATPMANESQGRLNSGESLLKPTKYTAKKTLTPTAFTTAILALCGFPASDRYHAMTMLPQQRHSS